MNCLKTGAAVWIQELSAIFPADVYGVGEEALVVRFNQRGRGTQEAYTAAQARELGATHFVLQTPIMNDDFVREDIGIAVCRRCNFVGELVE